MHAHSLSTLSIVLLVLAAPVASVLLWVVHDLSTRRRATLDDETELSPDKQLAPAPHAKTDRD